MDMEPLPPHDFGPTAAPENYNIIPVSWKGGFFSRPDPAPGPPFSSDQDFGYYQHDFRTQLPHDDDDDDVRSSCVFPCEGNERPSHGLSLSLSSSTVGLQPFELDYIGFGPSGSRSVDDHNTHYHGLIRGSRYMGPAQELLSEFCDLGLGQHGGDKMKGVEKNGDSWQSLQLLDLPHLQRRKTKLLQMLEEVDRRYKHYSDQMKSVVYSFESVAGDGAATAYSGLASRAMSRHFRCLRDGISSQIKATKQAMWEKGGCAHGTGKGETPRLRVLDQALRQQRALQQMGSMETHPWRPQRGLPERSVSALRAWLFEHFLHPYPSDVDKHILARQTGLSRSQVSNWFINARVRLWKPMVEEMYLEELKEEGTQNDAAFGDEESVDPSPNSDRKPTRYGQPVRVEPERLSSNNNPDGRNDVVAGARNKGQNLDFGEIGGDHSFGGAAAMEFDFASYGSGDGVSLTLGLHQHGNMNLAFSPAEGQGSMFYPRDVDDDREMIESRYGIR